MQMFDLFDNDQEKLNVGQFEKELNELKSITENYQKLLESLKESEAKYRFLTENSADIVWQLDSEMRFTYISPADEKIRGFKKEEVIGKPIWKMLTSDGIKLISDTITVKEGNPKESGKPMRFELKVYCKDDSLIWTELNVNPILDGSDKVIGYNGVTRDISERKKFEEEIHAKTKELKELNETKDKFFSIIAHDLRSPFQGLLGVSSILANEAEELSTEEIKEYAKLLNNSLTNQFKLLEDLLSWSRIQSGKMKYEPVLLKLDEEFENVLDMFLTNLLNKKISVDVSVEKDMVIFADRDMFWQLLRNLISNAIKFTNDGGRVSINAIENVDDILIEVKDTGVGIEDENIERLFRLEEHFSTEGTNGESGSGLGLILCKEIVDRHRCKIWVESEFGKGSSFKFTMPKINHS